MSAAPVVAAEPSVAELDLAAQQAAFVVCEQEYHAISKAEREWRAALEASPLYQTWLKTDAARADAAVALRQCGERVMELERALGKSDDYTNGQSHVKVGT